jgi:hypothetical protein
LVFDTSEEDDGLFDDTNLMKDWHDSAGQTYGKSSNNQIRLSIHIGDIKDLQTLSSILVSKDPKNNFLNALEVGKLKLKFEIKHSNIHTSLTKSCGLCFIRVERQLELRANSEDKTIIPDDLDFSNKDKINCFENKKSSVEGAVCK